MTKPITSVLTMLLCEEQKLDLFDPITKWFPQFGNMKVLEKQNFTLHAYKNTSSPSAITRTFSNTRFI
jgi:CubicO group peptidase (beta-lactamase class C family)